MQIFIVSAPLTFRFYFDQICINVQIILIFPCSSNKDIVHGNKQRTLELLWRVFIACYMPQRLSPIEKLNEEIVILTENLSNYNCHSIEQQLIRMNIIPLQKQHTEFTSIIHLLIKWAQLICAHYKFWLYDLQESFIDGRAFLYIISYYLPSLCDYSRDIKHLTTLATCQTRDEHIQFNLELGKQQQQLIYTYERNVKSNFRLLEECIKQFGTFSNDLLKYEYYGKDIPDERCTIIVLVMLAHDLLFSDNVRSDINFRRQSIFEELKIKYSEDDEPISEVKKNKIEDHQQLNGQQNNSMNNCDQIDDKTSMMNADSCCKEIVITKNEIEEESLKSSISSTTVNVSVEELSQKIHPIPLIQSGESSPTEEIHSENEDNIDDDTIKVITPSSSSPVKQDWSFVEPPAFVYDQTLSDSLYASLETMFNCQTSPRTQSSVSRSMLNAMNDDAIHHVQLLPEMKDESDIEVESEDSFNSARSSSTTIVDSRRTSIVAQITINSFQDFVELEKTIESEGTKTNPDNTSLFLINETIPSESDSVEMNKADDVNRMKQK